MIDGAWWQAHTRHRLFFAEGALRQAAVRLHAKRQATLVLRPGMRIHRVQENILITRIKRLQLPNGALNAHVGMQRISIRHQAIKTTHQTVIRVLRCSHNVHAVIALALQLLSHGRIFLVEPMRRMEIKKL